MTKHARPAVAVHALFAALIFAGCETASNPAPPVSAGPISTTAGGETLELSKLDQVPIPRFQARPQYPFALRRAKISGEAVVEFIVDPKGGVREARVVRATHADFGKAAVAAVLQWKFLPGRKAGREVNTRMQVPLVFSLDEPVSPAAVAAAVEAATARVELEAIDISKLDVMPRVRAQTQARPVYPAGLRGRGTSGEAVVDFVVDVEGNVRNAFAVRSTHPEFETAAIAAVAQWKFTPGRKGGRDVNTHMQVPIVFTMNETPPPPAR